MARHQTNQSRLFSMKYRNFKEQLPKDDHHFRVERNAKMIAVVIIIQYFIAVLPLRLLFRIKEHEIEEAQQAVMWIMAVMFPPVLLI